MLAGPPGAGKTTLLTCCAAELDPSLRVVVAEGVLETDDPLAPTLVISVAFGLDILGVRKKRPTSQAP